ncbi:hypothetical protein ACP4OV_014902 [Aristida adscensionis]
MAGDEGWVTDIILHVMLFWGSKLWGSWALEILLGLSFAMQLVLFLFAGCRWRGVTGVPQWIIWFCYVGANHVATSGIGRLISVSNADALGDRELVLFWAPFFLVHLGGPDSITAYELEDNKLSSRSVLGFFVQLVGAPFAVFRSVSISGRRTLRPAVWLMLAVGLAKYWERALALHQTNLSNLRSTLERQQRQRHCTIGRRRRQDHHQHPDLVMEAHSLFYICKQSIVDCWVKLQDVDDGDVRIKDASKLDWGGRMRKLIEMELSLMYELLYTKAAVIHTWHGYGIRALTPWIIIGAIVLVERSNMSRDVRHKPSDVWITRVLVAATFLQETVSLARALGSSWLGFLLHGSHCRSHEGLCLRLWRRLNRGLAKVKVKPDVPRRWSGKVGQLNMLELVTGAGHLSWGNEEKRYSRTLVMESQVKELVFEEMGFFLADFLRNQRLAPYLYLFEPWVLIQNKIKPESVWMIPRAHRNVRGQQEQASEDTTDYAMYMRVGENLILSILIWHIATDLYYYLIIHRQSDSDKQQDRVRESAVKTVSNYLMHLLVVRPEMLPGRVTRCLRLFQLACESMANFWHPPDGDFFNAAVLRKVIDLNRHHRQASPNHQTGQLRELASILYNLPRSSYDSSSTGDTIVDYAARLVKWLQDFEQQRHGQTEQFILQSWTILLFMVSYHCSNESHAQQLSRGGELTSVAWLMAEHAGLSLVSKIPLGDPSVES